MLIVEIHNEGTGTERSANYTYVVRVNDEILEVGTIHGHDRRDGWRALLVGICTPPKFRSALRPSLIVESAPNTRLHSGRVCTCANNERNPIDAEICGWCGLPLTQHAGKA